MPHRTRLREQVSKILEYSFDKVVSVAAGHYSCCLPIEKIRELSLTTRQLTQTERLKIQRFFIWLHEDELLYIKEAHINGR
jgi:hypothetical protein